LAVAIESAPLTAADKQKAIDSACSDIVKEYGRGSILLMGDRRVEAQPCIPTGIYSVDHDVIGIGGLPRGRIVEIYGNEGGGKSTTALTAVASVQQSGGTAAYCDAEHALDPSWMKMLGVDIDKVLLSQPDYGEQGLRIVERLIDTYAIDLIVVDSVAALVPRAEIDGEIGDAHVGLQARMMSQAMRKLAGAVRKSNTCLLFINQIRETIGTMGYGPKNTTPGGRALKFYASLRLEVTRIGSVKQGEDIVGNKVKIKAVKNKVAPPFRETEVELWFDRGFDKEGSLLTIAAEKGIVTKSGAHYTYKGERLGQGHANATAAVREQGLFTELLAAVREVDAA
jgi:recombination protein RecA